MKKILFVAMMLAAADAAVADYAYLYWEVNPPTDGDPWFTEGRAFDYAQIKAVDQGGAIISGALMNYDSSGQPVGGVAESWSTGDGPALATEVPVYADISSYASGLYGFVVEAYLNGDILWTSGAKWYDDLVRGNHIWAGDPSAMSGDIAVATYMVPEPTSGLLFLLGFAGLALRRRKRA